MAALHKGGGAPFWADLPQRLGAWGNPAKTAPAHCCPPAQRAGPPGMRRHTKGPTLTALETYQKLGQPIDLLALISTRILFAMRPAMNSQETFVKPRIPTQYNLDIIVNKIGGSNEENKMDKPNKRQGTSTFYHYQGLGLLETFWIPRWASPTCCSRPGPSLMRPRRIRFVNIKLQPRLVSLQTAKCSHPPKSTKPQR